MEQENKQENRFEETMIEGRNAVLEAFRSGKTVDKLFVLDGCQDGPVKTITREAKKQNTIIHYVAKERLDQLSETGKHQGVIAQAAAYRYAEVEDMLKLAEEKGEPPFLFILDGIEDPHNLGAIIRTAICRRTWRDHPETPRSGTDIDGCEDLGGSAELYAGGEGNQYFSHDRGAERERTLVCLCRYGRREHVPPRLKRTDRSGDWQ